MNSKQRFQNLSRRIRLLLPGLVLGTLVPAAVFAQVPPHQPCSEMIQSHLDWLHKGLVGTNGTQLLYTAVFGSMSSHYLPNNTTSSKPELVEYAANVVGTKNNNEIFFVGDLQASPNFSVTPSLTARVTITPTGVVSIDRLINNKPYTLHLTDTFTATCVGNTLTGYANGIQYTIGLQDTTAPHNEF